MPIEMLMQQWRVRWQEDYGIELLLYFNILLSYGS